MKMNDVKPVTIGYLRVSTVDQDLQKNKADILHLANEKNLGRVQWAEERVSGKVSWKKRQIAGVIEDLKAGDCLIVSELSRLGRSMLECMEILSVAMQREINVYAVKGNWQLDNSIPPVLRHQSDPAQKAPFPQSRQCMDRRLPEADTLTQEIAAWEQARNADTWSVNWCFTTPVAPIKLKRLYPSI